MPRWIHAAALAAVLLCAWPARAESRRVALVVGNNAGGSGLKPLRYAESDAGKMARVLAELGGVAPDDLFLLQGKRATHLERALGLLTARIAELHRRPDQRVVLIFYFSGHSDGEALELGGDRLPFSELKRQLAATGAEVRLAIIDSCQSGGLLAIKGGRAGPAFDVHLTDELATRGSVFLTSSAADEYALESSEVQGSFFTHHLVSGLRGAADASGDGRVTLAEAYRYAFDHTLASTAATTVGPQHPEYDYQLAGEGELVLTELEDRPSATLMLPAGLDRALVIDLARDQVVAEVSGGSVPRLDIPPGRYALRVWRGGKVLGERLGLAEHEERRVEWGELREEPIQLAAAKGSAPSPAASAQQVTEPPPPDEPTPGAGFILAAGASSGLAASVPLQLSLRLAVENMHATGIDFALQGGVGRGEGFRENQLTLRGGLRLGADLSRARAFLGLEMGIGANWRSGGTSLALSPLLLLGPRAGVRFAVLHATYLTLEADFPGAFALRDGRPALVALPSALLGVELPSP